MLLSGQTRAVDTDVVVVGAGAAGIAAAHRLRALGKSCIVLEAQRRLGGRVFTDDTLGQPFDAGAAYVHFAERNPWTAIAASLDLETVGGYRLWRGSRLFRDGQPLAEPDLQRRAGAMARLTELTDEISEDGDVSFERLVSQEAEDVRQIARARSLLAAGEDAQHVSVADFERLNDGTDLLVPAGYGTLVAKHGAGLPVTLGTAVTQIDWSGPGVAVTTTAGRIRARAAIVTVSVGLLQAEAIRFVPALPAGTRDALGGLRMGALSKVALRFDGARFGLTPHLFLSDTSTSGDSVSFEAWPFERDLVVANFGGDFARGLAKAGEAEAVARILDRFVRIIGADARRHFVAGRLAGWSEDRFALGSYAVVLPRRVAAREALARPIGDRVWLAGEATAGSASMTAGGAAIAGVAAADQFAALSVTGSSAP